MLGGCPNQGFEIIRYYYLICHKIYSMLKKSTFYQSLNFCYHQLMLKIEHAVLEIETFGLYSRSQGNVKYIEI